jgi:predicted ATPase/DNA-binding winged helix-turn-helix (wHTH) protein
LGAASCGKLRHVVRIGRVCGSEYGGESETKGFLATRSHERLSRVGLVTKGRVRGVEVQLTFTRCKVDLEVGEILWDDERTSRLTTRELALLRYLSTRMGVDVSRDELHQEVWGHGEHTISRAADDTVRRLRPKIELDAKEPRHLLTVHGEGYRLVGTKVPLSSWNVESIPRELTPLVGRDDVVAAARVALQEGRLVTLVGPGGVGKTRLALRLAHALSAVGFVDASEARTLQELQDRIAMALHLNEPHDVGELADRMAAVPGLVVLDNLEQVAEPAAEILMAWLRRPGEGQVVVTSRARLGVQGERVISVDPLGDEQGVLLLKQQLTQLGVPPVDEQKLVALQQLVEGVPLALELAAARVAGLGVERVVERLTADPSNLSAFRRPGPERHRSVRATIEWSWELLDPIEKRVLSHAAMFRGGVSLHALEVALDGLMPEGRDVDDCVAALNEHALLWLERPRRIRLFLAVREVAESHIEDRQEALRRHTVSTLTCCGVNWWYNPRSAGDYDALVLLAVDKENLLSVLERERGGDIDAWCRAVLFLSHLWHREGMVRRAVEELSAVLAVSGIEAYESHLHLILGMVMRPIDKERSLDALTRAEAGLRAPRDRLTRCGCLIELAIAIHHMGDGKTRDAYLSQAESLADGERGLQVVMSRAWFALQQGDNQNALDLVRKVDTSQLAPIKRHTMDVLELVALYGLGREAATAARFRAAAADAASLGERFKQAFALRWAGAAEQRAGDIEAAAECYRLGEAIYRRGGAEEWAAQMRDLRLALPESNEDAPER